MLKTIAFLLCFTPTLYAYCPSWDTDCYENSDASRNGRIAGQAVGNWQEQSSQRAMYNKVFGEKIEWRWLNDFEKQRLQKYIETGQDFLNKGQKT